MVFMGTNRCTECLQIKKKTDQKSHTIQLIQVFIISDECDKMKMIHKITLQRYRDIQIYKIVKCLSLKKCLIYIYIPKYPNFAKSHKKCEMSKFENWPDIFYYRIQPRYRW